MVIPFNILKIFVVRKLELLIIIIIIIIIIIRRRRWW